MNNLKPLLKYGVAILTSFSLLISSCSKKQEQSPQTLNIVTDGHGHTNNTNFVVWLTLINQKGVTVFHADTLKFKEYEITYKATVNHGDVLTATYDSNISNLQVSSPDVDIIFKLNGTILQQIGGGIYNTQAYYNGDPTVNQTTIYIP